MTRLCAQNQASSVRVEPRHGVGADSVEGTRLLFCVARKPRRILGRLFRLAISEVFPLPTWPEHVLVHLPKVGCHFNVRGGGVMIPGASFWPSARPLSKRANADRPTLCFSLSFSLVCCRRQAEVGVKQLLMIALECMRWKLFSCNPKAEVAAPAVNWYSEGKHAFYWRTVQH